MSAESKPTISVQNLTKRFGHFTAVDHISFTVTKGEIFGFLGPNGAGKSTTIRMLCGLLSSTSGNACVQGFDINREPESVRQSIGYMSQKFSLYRDLTVAENIAFFGGIYGLQGIRMQERTRAVLTMAGLIGMESHLTGTLSGALQQRLALGCAILHEPPVLFLDEPTSGVDPISRRNFWDLIQGMAASGVTILVTTHFLDEAEFCQRVAFISAGKLIALDTPAAVKLHAVDEDVFEVTLSPEQNVRERLEQIPGVLASSWFGPKLHVFCTRGRQTPKTLAAEAHARSILMHQIERVPVRLEDTFIRLVQKQAQGGK